VSQESVVLFDGVCNLCNAAVNFIIDRDPDARFRFASIQSAAGAELLRSAGISGEGLNTLVLIESGRARVRSDAVLKIATMLGGAWPLLALFRIIPRPLRDLVYRGIARSRYRIFGRKSECVLPTPELRARFLGDD
jgi:predicted DCC family thiol-disulfide oxidoreductase YuxK